MTQPREAICEKLDLPRAVECPRPLNWRANKATACQILLDRLSGGLGLVNGEDAPEDAKLEGIPYSQLVKSREWEWIFVIGRESLAAGVFASNR